MTDDLIALRGWMLDLFLILWMHVPYNVKKHIDMKNV